MKRFLHICFLLSLILVGNNGFAQAIKGVIKRAAYGGDLWVTCVVNPSVPLSENDVVRIYGKDKCNDLYKCEFENEFFLVEKKFFVDVDSIDKKLDNRPEKEKALFDEAYSKKLLKLSDLETKDANKIKDAKFALLKRMTTQGIVVMELKVYDESEYTDGTGIIISVLNTSKKRIKYVWFGVTGYNAVDDPVRDRLRGATKSEVKAVGPIEVSDPATYTYEYTWMTDIVEYAKLVSLKVQYMDGSMKVYPTPGKLVMTDAEKQLLEQK